MVVILLVMCGGAVGTLCRYSLARWINNQPWGELFPFGTMIVNVSGCFILGVVGGLLKEVRPGPASDDWFMLLGTGFCGGYTTFSTFAWETASLMRDNSWWLTLANIFGSVIAGILGVFVALFLVHGIFGKQ
jgi:CrcB protein